jgi:hypothetical protein
MLRTIIICIICLFLPFLDASVIMRTTSRDLFVAPLDSGHGLWRHSRIEWRPAGWRWQFQKVDQKNKDGSLLWSLRHWRAWHVLNPAVHSSKQVRSYDSFILEAEHVKKLPCFLLFLGGVPVSVSFSQRKGGASEPANTL